MGIKLCQYPENVSASSNEGFIKLRVIEPDAIKSKIDKRRNGL